MTMPKEILTIIALTNNGKIWIYIILYFILTYLLISLLTWSFLKPLKYLGIPTICLGGLLLIIRFLAPTLANFYLKDKEIGFIKVLLPSFLNPILISGILCLIIGIMMIIGYIILNKKKIIISL